MIVEVWTDGASRGNPGKSGIGVVIKKGNEIIEYKEFIGLKTNNVAEYTALLRAIDNLKINQSDSVIFYSDSELMVKQMKGIYKVKNENLKKLNDLASDILNKKYKNKWDIKHIPREENKETDRLANEAIDKSEENISEIREDSYQFNFK